MANPMNRIRPRTAESSTTPAQGTDPVSDAGAKAEAGRQAVRSLLRETGYAALGTMDVAVSAARRLADSSEKLPDYLSTTSGVVRDTFTSLSDRGRTVTGQIKRNPPAQPVDSTVDDVDAPEPAVTHEPQGV